MIFQNCPKFHSPNGSWNYVEQFWNITRGIYAKYHYKSCYYLYKLLFTVMIKANLISITAVHVYDFFHMQFPSITISLKSCLPVRETSILKISWNKYLHHAGHKVGSSGFACQKTLKLTFYERHASLIIYQTGERCHQNTKYNLKHVWNQMYVICSIIFQNFSTPQFIIESKLYLWKSSYDAELFLLR